MNLVTRPAHIQSQGLLRRSDTRCDPFILTDFLKTNDTTNILHFSHICTCLPYFDTCEKSSHLLLLNLKDGRDECQAERCLKKYLFTWRNRDACQLTLFCDRLWKNPCAEFGLSLAIIGASEVAGTYAGMGLSINIIPNLCKQNKIYSSHE